MPMDRREQTVSRDRLDPQGRRVRMDRMVLTVPRGRSGRRARRDPRVPRARQDLRGRQEDLLVRQDLRGHKVRRASRVFRVLRGPLGLRA